MPEAQEMPALEVEEESARYLIPAEARQPQRRLHTWHGIALAVLGVSLLAVGAMLVKRPSLTSGSADVAFSSTMETSQEYAKNFAQCAGNGIQKKCQPGCFCWKKSPFFSMCKPIDGLDHCDLNQAKAHVKKAKARLAPLAKKVHATREHQKKTHAHFHAALKKASETKDAASEASSHKAVTAEAATMTAVKHWHAGNVKKAAEEVEKAEKEEEEARKKAEKDASQTIKDAEEKVAEAKKALAAAKVETKKKVHEMIAKERKKVEEAKNKHKEVQDTPLEPVLKKRKVAAGTAAKKAQETAVAEKNAAEAFIKAQKTKQEADKAADLAVKNAKDAKEDLANAMLAMG